MESLSVLEKIWSKEFLPETKEKNIIIKFLGVNKFLNCEKFFSRA